jgi:hypothetical protein
MNQFRRMKMFAFTNKLLLSGLFGVEALVLLLESLPEGSDILRFGDNPINDTSFFIIENDLFDEVHTSKTIPLAFPTYKMEDDKLILISNGLE